MNWTASVMKYKIFNNSKKTKWKKREVLIIETTLNTYRIKTCCAAAVTSIMGDDDAGNLCKWVRVHCCCIGLSYNATQWHTSQDVRWKFYHSTHYATPLSLSTVSLHLSERETYKYTRQCHALGRRRRAFGYGFRQGSATMGSKRGRWKYSHT